MSFRHFFFLIHFISFSLWIHSFLWFRYCESSMATITILKTLGRILVKLIKVISTSLKNVTAIVQTKTPKTPKKKTQPTAIRDNAYFSYLSFSEFITRYQRQTFVCQNKERCRKKGEYITPFRLISGVCYLISCHNTAFFVQIYFASFERIFFPSAIFCLLLVCNPDDNR